MRHQALPRFRNGLRRALSEKNRRLQHLAQRRRKRHLAGRHGPAADEAGNIYLATGNGKFTPNRDYGDTVLKLDLHLKVVDSWTPPNQEALNARDLDVGSGGPLLLPHLILTGGKSALYVLDRDHMERAPRTIRLGRGVYSAPAYWNGHVFILADNDSLSDFKLENGRLPANPTSWGRHAFGNSATPTISAYGDKNAIVWLLETKAWNDYEGRPAVLHAYDANDLSRELFSGQAGGAVRFAIPSVVTGNVYVGAKRQVDVFGLQPAK